MNEEEKQSIIDEWSLYKKTCCPDCRGIVPEEGLIAKELPNPNSWENPPEYTSFCPHCNRELDRQDLDEETFEEWAYDEGIENIKEILTGH